MRIWLDDMRTPPKDSHWDMWAKNAADCILAIQTGRVKFISFDHDLQNESEKESGYSVAKFIEEGAARGTVKPIAWAIHSDNPVGRMNIEAAMKSAERFWTK